MKKTTFSVLFLLFLFSCTKESNNEQLKSEFKVMEYNTSTPLADAIVNGYKCANKSWLGNCMTIGDFVGTTNTNTEGKAYFSSSADIGILKATKNKYWDTENPNPGFSPEFYLTPISTLRVHIIRVNAQPATTVLNVVSQPEACHDCIWQTMHLLLPGDTTIYLKGGGFYRNSIGWYTTAGGPASGQSTPLVMVNRFDTAQFEISY